MYTHDTVIKIKNTSGNGTNYSNLGPVKAINKNNTNVSKNFKSVREAVEFISKEKKFKKIIPNFIYKALCGFYPNAYNYKWEFIEPDLRKKHHIMYQNHNQQKFLEQTNHNRKIVSFNLNAEFLKIYDNLLDVLKSENFNIDYRSIVISCNHGRNIKTVSKRQWRWEDECKKQ